MHLQNYGGSAETAGLSNVAHSPVFAHAFLSEGLLTCRVLSLVSLFGRSRWALCRAVLAAESPDRGNSAGIDSTAAAGTVAAGMHSSDCCSAGDMVQCLTDSVIS